LKSGGAFALPALPLVPPLATTLGCRRGGNDHAAELNWTESGKKN